MLAQVHRLSHRRSPAFIIIILTVNVLYAPKVDSTGQGLRPSLFPPPLALLPRLPSMPCCFKSQGKFLARLFSAGGSGNLLFPPYPFEYRRSTRPNNKHLVGSNHHVDKLPTRAAYRSPNRLPSSLLPRSYYLHHTSLRLLPWLILQSGAEHLISSISLSSVPIPLTLLPFVPLRNLTTAHWTTGWRTASVALRCAFLNTGKRRWRSRASDLRSTCGLSRWTPRSTWGRLSYSVMDNSVLREEVMPAFFIHRVSYGRGSWLRGTWAHMEK
jgi:hypothetical protein